MNLVDIGLFDPFQELAGVRRKRLGVAPLSFRINRVKRERRFAGAADSRNNGQCIMGDFKIDVLEIVDSYAANNDAVCPSEVRHSGHKQPIIQFGLP